MNDIKRWLEDLDLGRYVEAFQLTPASSWVKDGRHGGRSVMTEAFVTTVVGSMPKPAWLQEQLPLNAEGKQVHGKGVYGISMTAVTTDVDA